MIPAGILIGLLVALWLVLAWLTLRWLVEGAINAQARLMGIARTRATVEDDSGDGGGYPTAVELQRATMRATATDMQRRTGDMKREYDV